MKKIGILGVALVLGGTVLFSGWNLVAAAGNPVPRAESDDEFMKEAATGGMAEVALGQLALKKAQNSEVKAFAQMMVSDHTKANSELKALAAKKRVTLPAQVTAEQQATHDRLAALSGAEFDREYMAVMVADHDKTVAAFEAKAADASDADLQQWVNKTLPTLKMHQTKAKGIAVK